MLSLFSCNSNDIIIEEISFLYNNNNAQPSLVSNKGNLSLTWISSDDDMNASLNFRQFKNEGWTNPLRLASGTDWFVNWADFPTHAVSGNQVLTSYLKKSASGKYTYDVFLSLHNLSGEKVKEDFILNTDGFKAEHGFVSITANESEGFLITWLDGRNTVEKDEKGDYRPMTIRFAEITKVGDIINETELDSSVCDCCQTSMTFTNKGPLVVYRDRTEEEVRDIYVTRNIDDVWENPIPVHNDGWVIYGCPVNGPKVVSNSNNIAISWFTVSNGIPKVNLSFSESYGSSFGNPIKINDLGAIGRVDTAFLNEKEVIVSYMEGDDDGTYLRIKKVSMDGTISKPITISIIDGGRSTGVPQLEIHDDEIFIVWTIFDNESKQLKAVKLSSKDV
ncbi:MAG: sialidase [Flavobacteriaceae bacterium]|nr:sialidase [Flavobacteriaceae bacterium]